MPYQSWLRISIVSVHRSTVVLSLISIEFSGPLHGMLRVIQT